MNTRAETLDSSVAESLPSAVPAASAAAVEWGVITSLWKRDLMHLVRERSRWSGVVLQPLLFWLIIGSGMGSVFRLKGLEGVDYLSYFFPGILAMVILFTAVFATMGVIEDRKSGFLQQILVAPGSHAALVIGKTAGVTSMALIQVVACLLVAPFAGVDLLAVNWVLFFAVLILGCAGLTALNFVMAWLIDSTAGYHAIMSVLLLPLWIVSGAMFPAAGGWTAWVMRFNPMAYMVDGMRHALDSSASVANASASACVAVLAASTLVFGVLAVFTIKRRTQAGRI
jgi:ABC-2 type transport system permease protein